MMLTLQDITHTDLLHQLDYDPETGVFTRRTKVSNVTAGSVAGGLNGDGYVHIRIGSKKYKAHRLAWFYIYRNWPLTFVDHVNGVKSDNRIANLREATRAENQRNRKTNYNSASGRKGVCFDERTAKWKAAIRVNRKPIHLGYFKTAEEAHAAYCKAAHRLHGEFARTS